MSDQPICPVIATCGGCPLLALAAQEEHAHKVAILSGLHSALGLLSKRPTLVGEERRIAYRNRIRLRIDNTGVLAFYNEAKSPSCAVLVPALRDYVTFLREWSKLHEGALTPFTHLEARTADVDGIYGLYLTLGAEGTVPVAALDELDRAYGGQAIATNLHASPPQQRFLIDGETFQYVPVNGFLQVNLGVNRRLARHVVSQAHERKFQTFADLYCGSGNFALPLGRAGLRGQAVDYVASSIVAARKAGQHQGINTVQFHESDTLEQVRSWLARGRTFDFVLLDPPRAGVRHGLDLVARLARRCIAYCSCNPQTLERDLLLLRKEGWILESVTGFDMFPGTHHLEVVAWLCR